MSAKIVLLWKPLIDMEKDIGAPFTSIERLTDGSTVVKKRARQGGETSVFRDGKWHTQTTAKKRRK